MNTNMINDNQIKAYKVFDENWCCRGYDYKTNNGSAIGSVHKISGSIKMCENGFHACVSVIDCFDYYSFDSNNKVAEVIMCGEIINDGSNKHCCNELHIIKEIPWCELLSIVNAGTLNSGDSNSGDSNSGHWNSGHWNSGNRNSGDSNSGHWNSGDSNSGNRNSGHWNSGHWNSGNSNSGNRNSGHWNSGNRNSGNRNSGHWNSGNRNSGHWNSGNRNSGHFNTKIQEIINVFNKPCDVRVWEECEKPDFLYFDLVHWVSFDKMSEEDKILYPKAYVCDGYLKTYNYKEAFQKSYEECENKEYQTQLLKKLPNFDADIFYEISGIRIE